MKESFRGTRKHKRIVKLKYVKYSKLSRPCGCFLCCGDFKKYYKIKKLKEYKNKNYEE